MERLSDERPLISVEKKTYVVLPYGRACHRPYKSEGNMIADKERELLARIEQLEEKVMVLTIALNRVKKEARFRGLLDNIVITCEVALTEAGDEDYYDG